MLFAENADLESGDPVNKAINGKKSLVPDYNTLAYRKGNKYFRVIINHIETGVVFKAEHKHDSFNICREKHHE